MLGDEFCASVQEDLCCAQHLRRQARARHRNGYLIREREVETPGEQGIDQKGQALLHNLHRARLELAQRWRNQMMAERLWQAGEHANAQRTPTRADLPPRHVIQLATKSKDV